MYGSTAVELNSAFSLFDAGFLVLVTSCKKDEGWPSATRTWIDVSSPGLFLMAW